LDWVGSTSKAIFFFDLLDWLPACHFCPSYSFGEIWASLVVVWTNRVAKQK
jgi:hypothetical protein